MSTKEFLKKFSNDLETMKSHASSTVSGFGGLFAKTMGQGSLSVREKELIALGIGLAVQCVPCIRLHVQKCLAAGATREQIIEAAGVAVMMGGGPAYTHVPMVLEALDELEQ